MFSVAYRAAYTRILATRAEMWGAEHIGQIEKRRVRLKILQSGEISVLSTTVTCWISKPAREKGIWVKIIA